ncbi:uncharacterized protein ZBIST_4640 [Zygosaccharomyces bailii]|nr:uncharacterized protein ZBIST_4640 [Zygosaccharomyces bailii]
MVQAKQWILKTLPVPGKPFNFDTSDDKSTFELVEKDLSADQLKDGEILVETILLSNDPAQKAWIATVDKNYAKPLQVGENIPARGIGKVLASKNKTYQVGDYVVGKLRWTTHVILSDDPANMLFKIPEKDENRLWLYSSIFGGTGLTAYFIFFQYANLREREEDYGKTYLISGAAGAVGTVCVQLALNVFKASKVIAVAGGPEKVKYVESFDPSRVVGVDYKAPSFKEDLQRAAGGINTVDYFVDNVGGHILDLGTSLLKVHATIIACGAISGYNNGANLVFKNYVSVITKRLTIKGVLVTDHMDRFPEALRFLNNMVTSGKLDTKNAATFKDAKGENFKKVPLIWDGLFHGTNKGKLISVVRDPK